MYGKIFDSMYDGTLYGHWQAIVTLQQMIVLATPDGIVDMTPQAMAARTSIPLEIIQEGLKVLADPDPYSRTPGEEGRRIVLLDDRRPWGWRLVNHGKYKRLRDLAQKREADRERIAEKRSKTKDVAIASRDVANVAHSDTDTDSDSTKEKDVAQAASQPVDNPLSGQKATTEAWNAYTEMMFGTYQVEPPRNAKAMGQLALLVGRVGRADAVALIRFYFTQRNQFYSRVKHSLDVLLKDSNSLLITMKQHERQSKAAA